jgi:Haem-dependent oxidative N-demethylase, alpha subunit-like
VAATPGWLDELDLDPARSWLRMGTRALGAEPWLLADGDRDAQLALKRRLYEERADEVHAARPGTEAATEEARDLVLAAAGTRADPSRPALVDAGLRVQEDLCLMVRRDGAWHLDAASLSFPSRWRLADKLGRPLAAVHGPVPGYEPALASRVDQLFDRLGARPVRRRNWFVHADDALFQPASPPGGDPIVPAAGVRRGLFVRSERQTLRRLQRTGAVLFTIRIQQAPLGTLLAEPARAAAFAAYLRHAPTGDLAHRGLAPAQVDELLAQGAIASPGSGWSP